MLNSPPFFGTPEIRLLTFDRLRNHIIWRSKILLGICIRIRVIVCIIVKIQYRCIFNEWARSESFPNRRDIFIAYDICDHRRLVQVHQFLKGSSTGEQKSVYECFLTDAEAVRIECALSRLINDCEDRVYVLGKDCRSKTHTMGIAVQPKDPSYFYFG